MALLADVADADLFEADPTGHAANETVVLAHGLERIDDAAIHQAEIASIDRDIDIGDAVDDAVEEFGAEELEKAFALALIADGVDDLKTGFPALDHLQN